MRNAAVYAGLLATTFASLGQAMVNLTILSPIDDIRFNDGILVEWATDKTYSLEFNLVKKEDFGWSVAQNFFDDLVAEAGEGNITVIVPRVARNREYALWLSGSELDEPRGYANLTEWFVIKGKYKGH